MKEVIAHKLLTLIENYPDMSQRELAEKQGISLGKANYCIKALMEKSWLKARNFKNSCNKTSYARVLTSTGLSEKAFVSAHYLIHKEREYETPRIEIEILRQQVSEASMPSVVNAESRLMVDAPGSSGLAPLAS